MEDGCYVLSIEYGYLKKQIDIKIEKEIGFLIKETKDAIDKALENDYKNIILVGKSLGTFLMNQLRKEYSNEKISFIYLTPVDVSVPEHCNNDTLIVFGSGDRQLSKEKAKEIKRRKDIEALEVEDADHSLEYESTSESIKVHLRL
ncbi:MAG: hypothetical protein FH751_09820 [Firmicutes bacterium]|nr:hypothetical protein [Bacillota bacterium]